MKQNMKRALLVLCMAVCFLSLAACSSSKDVKEPVPQEVMNAIKSGAANYLVNFDRYDDEQIAKELKLAERQKDNVLISALTSWKGVRGDLGRMETGTGAILSEEITRVGDDHYTLTARVRYEKKEMDFTLSVKEVVERNGSTMFEPTELIFSPAYTTSEKLAKAGKNTLLGMGTVFCVLIFISFIISTLKGVNTWEAKRKEAKDAKDNNAASAAVVPAAVPTASAAPIPAAPVITTPVQESLVAAIAAVYAAEHENLADDSELAAVITAAIAATQGVPAEGLVVRSIRRKPTSKWKNA